MAATLVQRLESRVRALRRHRCRSTGWREHFAACDALLGVVRRPLPSALPDAGLTVVLPHYARLHNAELAAYLALASSRVKRVVIVNDNPAVRLREHVHIDDPRLVLIDREQCIGPVGRYLTARDFDSERCVSLDDDLFLSPVQLERLDAAQAADPSRPHGLFGQLWNGEGHGFRNDIVRADGEVDLLNRGYAFTRAQLHSFLALLNELGVSGDAAHIAVEDDVVLSFTGAARPRSLNLGAFGDCPSERSSPFARSRRPEAGLVRRRQFERLRALRPLQSDLSIAIPKPPVWPRTFGMALAVAPTGLQFVLPHLLPPLFAWLERRAMAREAGHP